MANRIREGWKRQLPLTRAAILVLVAAGMTGVVLICNGLYIKAKAELSQYLLMRSFSAVLAGDKQARPWPWADFTVAALITVPRLNRSAIVLEGATGQALAFGPALVNGTPNPGDLGTSVIAAHRDTHFEWLKDVQPGDLVTVTTRDGVTSHFRANDGRIAEWNNNGINTTAFGRHLALATCWPFNAQTRGPLRYILNADLVDDAPLSMAAAE